MKTLLLSLITFIQVSQVFAQVPTSWTNSLDLENNFISEDTTKLEKAFSSILAVKQNAFATIPDFSQNIWNLQSIKTELGVSAEGTLGVMGAGGEAAVELIWIRKNQTQRRTLAQETSTEAEEIHIQSDMSETAMHEEITMFAQLALNKKKSKIHQKLVKNLLRETKRFQKIIREIETAPKMGAWYPYKFQLELFVSAEGDIYFMEVGKSIRLRLEWWRIEKQNVSLIQPPLATPQLSQDSSFVSGLGADLDTLGSLDLENDFRLNCIKFGIGTTVSGNLVIAKAKMSSIGSLFFKRDLIDSQFLTSPLNSISQSSLAVSDGKTLHQVPRVNFRAGLQKGMRIAEFFAKAAKSESKSDFELNVIEAEFNIFLDGGIGLVNVEGSSLLTLFITRNVII